MLSNKSVHKKIQIVLYIIHIKLKANGMTHFYEDEDCGNYHYGYSEMQIMVTLTTDTVR